MGPCTYIYAVFIYHIPLCWLKESARNVFIMVFRIAVLMPGGNKFSTFMNTLLAEYLSQKKTEIIDKYVA